MALLEGFTNYRATVYTKPVEFDAVYFDGSNESIEALKAIVLNNYEASLSSVGDNQGYFRFILDGHVIEAKPGDYVAVDWNNPEKYLLLNAVQFKKMFAFVKPS